MKNRINILACVLTLCTLIVGTTAANELTGIYGGVVQYNNPEYDSVAMLDFSYSVERRQFEFYQVDSIDTRLYARIFAQVDLYDNRGYVIDSASTIFSTAVESMKDTHEGGIRLFDRMQLFARPGVYSARITVIDVVDKDKGEVFIDEIVVEPPERDSIDISGVCIAYKVRYVGDKRKSAKGRLVRNGYEIVPNPLALLSDKDSVMSIYTELYNLLSPDVESTEPVYVSYVVVNPQTGQMVRPLGTRKIERPGNSAGLAEEFDILGLPVGEYQLQIAVNDRAREQVDTQLVAFRIITPRSNILADSKASPSLAYDTLSPEVKVQLVSYLLSPNERTVLKSLSRRGQLNFLEQYWREHDSDPSTAVNESRQQLIERFEYVNRMFSTNSEADDGWSTDRGRIYLTYGPPEERDQNPAPIDSNPYEIWHYRQLQEGKVFVFEDVRGGSDYKIVHSNVEGEYYSEYWNERINLEGVDVY